MRSMWFVTGLLLCSATAIASCAASSQTGGGGAGGDDEWWGNGGSGPSSSGSGGTGNGKACEAACAKVLECGAMECPPEYLDCSMPSPQNECIGQCVLNANCAQIFSIDSQNPDPELVQCAEACQNGGSSSSSSSSSASSSSSSSSSSSGGSCSTCSQLLLATSMDPPCAASQPIVDDLFTCACNNFCTSECEAICVSQQTPPPACFNCAQMYCNPELTACTNDT